MSDNTLTIDVESIVKKKLGKHQKWVPNFVFKWLKNFIHEDYINGYLVQGREGVDFCKGTLEYLGVTITVEGIENIPKEGRYTFASNHPLGAVDGVTLGYVFGEPFGGKINLPVNDFLMNLKGFAPLCVPINKTGSQSRNLPQMIQAMFESDNQVAIFPAGKNSRIIDGKIQDPAWQKTFIIKSVQTERDIVPVHFIGENSPRFYRAAKVGEWLMKIFGLKFNICMAFLPDEMYRARGKHFTIRIGKPIPYQTFDKTRSATEWAAWVREIAVNL